MKKLLFFLLLLSCLPLAAQQRQYIWPKGQMPDAQPQQIAAMTDESNAPGFKPDKHRIPYLEWFAAPDAAVDNDACMILISGGSYECCCDVGLIQYWKEELTKRGVQCVNFVYRTPRPEGLPIYQTAWEDGLGRRPARRPAGPCRGGPARLRPGEDRCDLDVGRVAFGAAAGHRLADADLPARGCP